MNPESSQKAIMDKFLEEHAKPPSVEDIKRWNMEISGKEDYSTCSRCTTLSASCLTYASDVVACARCVQDKTNASCSRNAKEKLVRVGRVLGVDETRVALILRVRHASRTNDNDNTDDVRSSTVPVAPTQDSISKLTTKKRDNLHSIQANQPVPSPTSPSTLCRTGQSEKETTSHSGISSLKLGCRGGEIPSESSKELRKMNKVSEKRSEDVKTSLDDAEVKLKDEISRSAELSRQLEEKRRENGELQLSITQLQDNCERLQKSLDFKTNQLEVEKRKGEDNLRRAQQSYTKLKQSASELKSCRLGLAIRTEEMEKERAVNRELVRRNMEETHERNIRRYEVDRESWALEKKALEEIRTALEHDLAMKEQIIQEMQEQSKAQDQRLQQSAEMERELDDLRREKTKWQGRVKAGDDEVQKVKAELDSRNAEIHNMATMLSAERNLAEQNQQALQDTTKKLADRIAALDPVHRNLESLIQQFRSVRSDFFDHKIPEGKVLEMCDHLGWQLVLVSDSVKEGIQPEGDSTSASLAPSIATTSGSTVKLLSPTSSLAQRPDIHACSPSPLLSPLPSTKSTPIAAYRTSQNKSRSFCKPNADEPPQSPTPFKAPFANKNGLRGKKRIRRVALDDEDSTAPRPV